MTQTLATQAAALALAAIMTLGAVTGVSGAAAHQRVTLENQATLLAWAGSGTVQHVTVVGHRTQRA